MAALGKGIKILRKRNKMDLRALQKQISMEQLRRKSARYINIKGSKCAECGTKDNLTRHHTKHRVYSVIVLCNDCHIKLHKERR